MTALSLIALVGAAVVEGSGRPTVVTRSELQQALRPGRGRPRLAHFWASWCRPCIAEWPAFAELLRRSSRRPLDIVTVSLDEASAAPAARRALARLGRVPGRTLLVPLEEALPAIRAVDPDWDGSLPTTLLLGGEGRVVLSQRGVTRFDALEGEIERIAPLPPATEHLSSTHMSRARRER